MKDIKSSVGRLGFTLIELLVVVAIIGVLIAATMPLIGGSRDSALAAKCMANMRNITEATLICANRNGEDHGWYPSAGLYRSIILFLGSTKPHYRPRRAWLSNYGNPGVLNSDQMSPTLGDVAHFTDRPEKSTFAVTNGVIWSYTGHAFDVYRCPAHTLAFEKKKGYPPAWSFMMNQEFGYNRGGKGVFGFFGASIKDASIKVSVEDDGDRFKKGARSAGRNPDKVLMFAEVQGVEIEDKKHNVKLEPVTSGDETDGVFRYTKEQMGFNHRLAKGRYCGHVAFADGHVEKIVMPTDKSYIKDLSRYLCQGFDVPHDGRKYTPNDADK